MSDPYSNYARTVLNGSTASISFDRDMVIPDFIAAM